MPEFGKVSEESEEEERPFAIGGRIRSCTYNVNTGSGNQGAAAIPHSHSMVPGGFEVRS